MIRSGSLKSRFGSEKTFDFCSVECGKKWIDAEGSKYRDLTYERAELIEKFRERINASK